MQIELFLDGRQVNHTQIPHLADVIGICDPGLIHRLTSGLHHAAHAGLTDEHVMGFLGEHEAAGAAERIKS